MKINGITRVLPEYVILFVVLVRGRRRRRRRRGCLTWVCAEAVSSGDAWWRGARTASSQRLTLAAVTTPRMRAPVASPGCGMKRNRSPITLLVVASFYELSNHFQNQDKINSHRISMVAVERSFNFGGGVSSLSTI